MVKEALMQPIVRTFFDEATATATHLVIDPATKAAAIIDPVLDYEPKGAVASTTSAEAILEVCRREGLNLQYVLETHAHADHLSAAHYIRGRTGAKTGVGANIVEVQKTFALLFEAGDVVPDGRAFDLLLTPETRLPLGELFIEVMRTPGHTQACVTYLIGDAAFVGDTLFMPDYGTARADFPGGDAATLYRSIQRILALPSETRMFVGHDYLPEGRTQHRWETTVAEQRIGNAHVHDGVSEEAFVALRRRRDATLEPPTLILPSLQVNIRGGAFPPATPGGRVFLRLPVTFEGGAG
jgi:glyoxylase-like metal-dependent hydrolase (beta-lactamase superfamily II)